MSFQRIVYVFLFILIAHTSSAQQSMVVKTTVNKKSILIGEPIELTIEADIPADAPIGFVHIDSIPHFEFLGAPIIDTINTNEGTIIKGRYRITSFDSGHWVIPSYNLVGEISSDSIPVDVGFAPFDPTKDYHDIKDIVDVQTKKKKFEWWYYAAGGLVLLILLIFLLRKKKPVVTAPIAAVNAYEVAMKDLEQLRKEKPEVKEFYTRITNIFRLYISRKKGINSLQETMDDLLLQLKEIPLPKDEYESLAQSLRMSDFVKFAKYIPSATDNQQVFDTIKKVITDIEKLP